MYYFLMTSLFHDWTFEPLNLLDLFAQSPTPLPSGNHWFVLCVYESVFIRQWQNSVATEPRWPIKTKNLISEPFTVYQPWSRI